MSKTGNANLRRRRRRERAWFDRVMVERALRLWSLGQRAEPELLGGRALTQRERMVVRAALIEVGETPNGATQHVRMSTQGVRAGERDVRRWELHRERIAAAVAYLDRLNARELIATRRHPISWAQAERMIAASPRGAGGVFNGDGSVLNFGDYEESIA